MYEIAKMLHLFSMVIWFAGLIGIFRIFVQAAEHTSEAAAKVLSENGLWRYKVLAMPGMVGAWIFGLAMISLNPEVMKTEHWLHAKLALVLFLSGFMGLVGKSVKGFANNGTLVPPGKAKIFNQISVLALVIILVLAVMRPF